MHCWLAFTTATSIAAADCERQGAMIVVVLLDEISASLTRFILTGVPAP